MFKLNKAKSLFKWGVTSFVVLSITACAGFNRSMEVQNDYASEIDLTDASKLYLAKDYSPSVIRGIIENEYSAFVPAGVYVPIYQSKGRTFYQAPEGFEYRGRGEVDSLVGGLVQVEPGQNSTLYVWLFPKQPEYFEIQENGEWIKDIKPGLSNLLGRGWVEEDLVVMPSEEEQVIFSGACIDFSNLETSKKELFTSNIGENVMTLASKHHQYPSVARKQGIEGEVVVNMVLDQEGVIKNFVIKESSGYKVLDDITLETFNKMKADSEDNPLTPTGICFNDDLMFIVPVAYILR
ncbi:energy transducer TonB [Marinomonas ostreistagni]|uniref:Energy transducer TonB n=1 Tax=Marinomonas ostreistagni TaxID=359209 RepID=A0ABS0Z997_9GAMM|nr:energy transducer TonB [Marinomonas ostreistagni]MBJ7549788.1 energy transducer TonB [Marinomonas ostreistagni]